VHPFKVTVREERGSGALLKIIKCQYRSRGSFFNAKLYKELPLSWKAEHINTNTVLVFPFNNHSACISGFCYGLSGYHHQI